MQASPALLDALFQAAVAPYPLALTPTLPLALALTLTLTLFQAAVALRPLPFRHGVAKVMHFAQAVILGFGLGLKLGLEP